MLFICAGCIFGMWASVHGKLQIKRAQPPELYGTRGIVKFVHGLPLHAIQQLPLLAWGYKQLGLAPKQRLWLIQAAAAGMVCLTLFALTQTVQGRARFDLNLHYPLAVSVLVSGVALICVPPVAWLVVGRWSNTTTSLRVSEEKKKKREAA
jgi:hypothetical protein